MYTEHFSRQVSDLSGCNVMLMYNLDDERHVAPFLLETFVFLCKSQVTCFCFISSKKLYYKTSSDA